MLWDQCMLMLSVVLYAASCVENIVKNYIGIRDNVKHSDILPRE